MLALVVKSLWNRRVTAALAVIAIAVSVALILSVDKVRRDAMASFTQTISGVDLVVGARSGAVQLLLYSVFRIGNATNNISWESVEDIRRMRGVGWTVPLSLGDSHRGYRVLGTTSEYFERYRHGDGRALELASGAVFDDVFDAVIGSEVARELGYAVGREIVVAHGTGSVAVTEHADQPFRVSGVLAPTGTPVDRTVHVSLEGIEAMHVDWASGMQRPGEPTSPQEIRQMTLETEAVTALLVGLESRGAVFRVQRAINEYRAEPLLAILPGVALQQLWDLVGVAENALLVVSAFVVLAGLINLVSVLLAGLNERRREMAILRATGARPAHVFALLVAESGVLAALGVALGLALHLLAVAIGGLWIEDRFGIAVPLGLPGARDWAVLGGILLAGLGAGALPAWRAYRLSLADGMAQRL